ncbi:RPF2 factor, partial [Acromyrmex insinuator]
MKDLYDLKKPDVQMMKQKNDILPFEDITPIEKFAFKYTATHNKKRPHNLIMGRMYEHTLLDMIEFGLENYEKRKDFKVEKITSGIKPLLSNTRTPRIEFVEIPRVDLVCRRNKFASEDLFNRACRKPNAFKAKTKKNISKDTFGTTTNKSQHPNVTSLRTTIEATFVGMDSATLQFVCSWLGFHTPITKMINLSEQTRTSNAVRTLLPSSVKSSTTRRPVGAIVYLNHLYTATCPPTGRPSSRLE